MSHAETRLRELGVLLPSPPAPVASYVPFTVSGRQVFISGQIPLADGEVKFIGKLGDGMPLEDGQAAARLCAVNVIAQLKAACHDLDRVTRCLKLGVFVNATPDFTQQSQVVNGASDLLVAVFGDAGRHARAAVGVASLPAGVPVEVEMIVEVAD